MVSSVWMGNELVMDKEITLKDIEDDYEAFCSFDRHDERIGWLIHRVNKLEHRLQVISPDEKELHDLRTRIKDHEITERFRYLISVGVGNTPKEG